MIWAPATPAAGISPYAWALPCGMLQCLPRTPFRCFASVRRGSLMAAVQGTIKRLVGDKGFGFVAAQDGSEYFFHQSACEGVRFDDLREGQSVSFEKGQGP